LALSEGGAYVEVFEAARTPGGRARSVSRKDLLFDNGQHILIGAYSRCLKLFASFGLPEAGLLRIPLALEVPGKFRFQTPRWPAPWHIIAGVVSARGLTSIEKFSLLRWMIARKLQRFKAPEGVTVDAWCADLPASVMRWMIEPLCISALNTPSSEASAESFAAVLRDSLGADRAASDLLIPIVDLGTLMPERAMASLQARGCAVHLGRSVRRVTQMPNGWQIEAAMPEQNQTPLDLAHPDFDAVVLATPPWITRDLIAQLNCAAVSGLQAILDNLRYEPITTVYLKPTKPVAMSRPMLAMEYDPKRDAHGQFLFDKTRCGGPAGWLAVVVSAASSSAGLDSSTLAEACSRQTQSTIGQGFEVEDFWVVTEKRATFACTPGLKRPGAQLPVPGLYLAGDYTEGEYPATLEQAVRSGETAARTALANWGLRSKGTRVG
jgi:squalene-associated FAD-dependent desaturase